MNKFNLRNKTQKEISCKLGIRNLFQDENAIKDYYIFESYCLDGCLQNIVQSYSFRYFVSKLCYNIFINIINIKRYNKKLWLVSLFSEVI
jgi:hypothetical protein